MGPTNERGLRLLEFARMNNMVIANTRYQHKHSGNITWKAPDGITKNQIDFILVEKKCTSNLNGHKTISFPGADRDSDHNLVSTAIKMKLKKRKKQPTTK